MEKPVIIHTHTHTHKNKQRNIKSQREREMVCKFSIEREENN